jgi:hypothetical protein
MVQLLIGIMYLFNYLRPGTLSWPYLGENVAISELFHSQIRLEGPTDVVEWGEYPTHPTRSQNADLHLSHRVAISCWWYQAS